MGANEVTLTSRLNVISSEPLLKVCRSFYLSCALPTLPQLLLEAPEVSPRGNREDPLCSSSATSHWWSTLMSTCVFCEDSVLIVVTPVAWAWHCLLGPLYTTNLPKWRAGWSSGEQITSSLNGCTSLPASHHRTACIFSCSKSYMITPLSIYHPNSSLSGAGNESLRQDGGWQLINSFHYSYLSPPGSSAPKQNNSHKTKWIKLKKPFYFNKNNKTVLTDANRYDSWGEGGAGDLVAFCKLHPIVSKTQEYWGFVV